MSNNTNKTGIDTGIQQIEFRRANSKSVRAYATITVGELILRNFSIVSGKDGLFISWPSMEVKNPRPGGKKYLNTVFYTSDEYKEAFNDEVLSEFNAWDKANPAPPANNYQPKSNYNSGNYVGKGTNTGRQSYGNSGGSSSKSSYGNKTYTKKNNDDSDRF